MLRFSPLGLASVLPLCYAYSMEIKYSDLTPTTEQGAVCYPCREYKGMVDCPECGASFCLFCADGCECCGATIVY